MATLSLPTISLSLPSLSLYQKGSKVSKRTSDKLVFVVVVTFEPSLARLHANEAMSETAATVVVDVTSVTHRQ